MAINLPITVPMTIAEDGAIISFDVSSDEALEFGLGIAVKTIVGEHYSGAYEVTPRAYDAVVLETSGKVLDENVRVLKVPYHANNNLFGGKTAYIAEEATDGN